MKLYFFNQKGLTLVELLITMVISIILLTPIFTVLNQAYRSNIHTTKQTIVQIDTQRVFSNIVDNIVMANENLPNLETNASGTDVFTLKTISDNNTNIYTGYILLGVNLYKKNLDSLRLPTSTDIASTNPILTHVKSFLVKPEQSNGITYLTILLTTELPSPSGTGQKTGITLQTKVYPRLLP